MLKHVYELAISCKNYDDFEESINLSDKNSMNRQTVLSHVINQLISQQHDYQRLLISVYELATSCKSCDTFGELINFSFENYTKSQITLPSLLSERLIAYSATLVELDANRQQLRKALLKKSSKKIDKACHKFLSSDYFPLREQFNSDQRCAKFRQKFTAQYFPHFKYFISFIDAVLTGQTFLYDPEKQTLSFKHFKKDKQLKATLFVTTHNIHPLFEENNKKTILDDMLIYLDSITISQEKLIQRLSLLKRKQRKTFVMALRLFRYFQRPFQLSNDRAEIKNKLINMSSDKRTILDGFHTTFSNPHITEKRKFHVYAGQILNKIRDQKE